MQNSKSNISKIIIVVLAVALVSSITYIALRNTPNTKNENTISSIVYPSTADTLSVAEWGIEGHYIGAFPIQYEIKDGNTLRFTTTATKDICGSDYSGFITRYTADQHIDQKGYGVVVPTHNTSSAANSSLPKVHIGDYYYVLTSAQSPCISAANADKDMNVKGSDGRLVNVSSAQGDVASEIHDIFLTLTKKQ